MYVKFQHICGLQRPTVPIFILAIGLLATIKYSDEKTEIEPEQKKNCAQSDTSEFK